MQVTFLGTGTSHGVPTIDCMLSDHARCPRDVCRKAQQNPRYRRTRCSILIEKNGQALLVDVSPDFREQVLRERVRRIDAVVLTHRHADHIMGIPDIRSYAMDKDNPLPIYGSPETLDTVRSTFDYAFNPSTFVGGGIPRLSLNPIEGPVTVCGMEVVPAPVEHGNLVGCYGYRIDDLGYVPDLKSMSGSSRDILRGVDTLILNCLRIEREHSTHLLLRQSLELVRELRPRQCWFVHMTHEIDHEVDAGLLDPGIGFAWDGLKVMVGGEEESRSRKGRKGEWESWGGGEEEPQRRKGRKGEWESWVGGEEEPQERGERIDVRKSSLQQNSGLWNAGSERTENWCAREIVDAAYVVHRELGPGLLESLYEECLCRELLSRGLNVQRQIPLTATYKGTPVDCGYRIDLVVEDLVIVELKACSGLEPIHTAQILTYLKLMNKKLGLLINFNVVQIKCGIKRVVNGLQERSWR